MQIIHKSIIIFIFIFVSANVSFGQVSKFNIGTYFGFGEISSNSPSQVSAGGSFFIEVKPGFVEGLTIYTSYFYARKFEYYIPQTRIDKYYPWLQGFTLQAAAQQNVGVFYLQEGAGPAIINDHTFSDRNKWALGTAFNLSINLDLSSKVTKGLSVGGGIEYALAFGTITPTYFSTYLRFAYRIMIY